jgi:autotransporter-associated beta strand protein
MKPKSTLRAFLAMASSTLLTITYTSATPYYWDANNGTPGFQDANPGPAGTWSGTTTTSLSAPYGFTTDSTGSTTLFTPAVDPDPEVTTSVTTTINDDIFFGTGNLTATPPLYPFTGVITIDGTVNAKSVYQSENSPGFAGINNPTVNFPAEGSWEHATTGTVSLPAIAITGASISMTWKVGFSNNLNITAITSNGAAKNILTGPGRLVVNNTLNLGAAGTPFVFDGGMLRMNSGIAWTKMSELNADHPVSFTLNKDVGIDRRHAFSFEIDNPLNLGTGGLTIESQGTALDIILSQDYQYSGPTTLTSGSTSVETTGNLGLPASNLVFNGGTLKIRGTTLSNFSTIGHTVVFTDTKSVALNIDDAGHTFTVDQALNHGTGGFTKSGLGTVNLDQTSNTHTGTTTVSAGTLNVSNIPAAVSGLTSVTGTGTLNLSGDNSASTGGVTLNGATATLNLNSSTALGTGTCTLQAGTLKNSVTTLSTTHPVTLAGNFTWDGVTNLTFGSGAITMAAGRTITLNGTGSVLTFGGVLTNTQAGNPTLTANGAGNTLVIGGGYDLSNSSTNRTPVISGTGNVTINGPVTNGLAGATACALTKTGTGTLTLNGDNTYDGLTTHSTAGSTLTLAGDNSGAEGGITMNNGTAVLNVNHAAALGTGTFTLTSGTIDNTSGSAKILSTNNVVNIGGNVTFGGSNNLTFGNGAVSNNGSRTFTLNGTGSILTFGGVMTNTLANNQTTTVNGAGNTLVLGGYDIGNPTNTTNRTGTFTGDGDVTITGAVTNGVGGATACALTKSGTGTLTLKGINTYAGATTVNTDGTLALVGGSQSSAITVNAGGALGFEIGSATTSTSSVNLTNGTVTISNPGSVDNSSDYLLMTAASGFTFTDPLTQLGTAIPNYELQLKNSNTELWLVYSVGGSAYQTWATGNEPFDGDANGDGVKDGLAFLLGAATPATDATGLLPTTSQTGGNLVMNFTCLATAERGTATLTLEYDGDLAGTWLSVPVPAAVGAPNPIVETTTTGSVSFVATDGGTNANGDALITVEATISDATESASGKLFGRLKAVNP